MVWVRRPDVARGRSPSQHQLSVRELHHRLIIRMISDTLVVPITVFPSVPSTNRCASPAPPQHKPSHLHTGYTAPLLRSASCSSFLPCLLTCSCCEIFTSSSAVSCCQTHTHCHTHIYIPFIFIWQPAVIGWLSFRFAFVWVFYLQKSMKSRADFLWFYYFFPCWVKEYSDGKDDRCLKESSSKCSDICVRTYYLLYTCEHSALRCSDKSTCVIGAFLFVRMERIPIYHNMITHCGTYGDKWDGWFL